MRGRDPPVGVVGVVQGVLVLVIGDPRTPSLWPSRCPRRQGAGDVPLYGSVPCLGARGLTIGETALHPPGMGPDG
jgi:hypothetical protein